jgi:hypothetical protein
MPMARGDYTLPVSLRHLSVTQGAFPVENSAGRVRYRRAHLLGRL